MALLEIQDICDTREEYWEFT